MLIIQTEVLIVKFIMQFPFSCYYYWEQFEVCSSVHYTLYYFCYIFRSGNNVSDVIHSSISFIFKEKFVPYLGHWDVLRVVWTYPLSFSLLYPQRLRLQFNLEFVARDSRETSWRKQFLIRDLEN
jgi:hypothetical protein